MNYHEVQVRKSDLIIGVVFLGMLLFWISACFQISNDPERIAAAEATQQALSVKQQQYAEFVAEQGQYKPYDDVTELVEAFRADDHYVKLVQLVHRNQSFFEWGTTYLAGAAVRGNRVLVPVSDADRVPVSMDRLYRDFAWLGKDGKLHVFGGKR